MSTMQQRRCTQCGEILPLTSAVAHICSGNLGWPNFPHGWSEKALREIIRDEIKQATTAPHQKQRREVDVLQITHTLEDLRLLEAADIAERASQEGMYDQENIGACGTPACMLGGYAKHHPEFRYNLMKHFGLSTDDWHQIFGCIGCNNAGRDGVKAAAYVRAFVEARAKARIT